MFAVGGYAIWMFVMVSLLCSEIRSLSHRFQFLLLFSAVRAFRHLPIEITPKLTRPRRLLEWCFWLGLF
jgi:hypothetical protein